MPEQPQTLNGQVAIVVNACCEFSRSVTTGLIEAGARVALVDPSSGAASQVIAEIGMADNATSFVAGYTEIEVDKTLRSIEKCLGAPTILVTLPADPTPVATGRLTSTNVAEIVQLEVMRAFLWSTAFSSALPKNTSGAIVHMTGLCGLGGWPGWLPHTVAFSAVHAMVHTLAVEWGPRGIRVNAIVPGLTAALAKQVATSNEQATPRKTKSIFERIPTRKLMPYSALIDALLYLLDPQSSFVNGEILKVDGGWDIWGRLKAQA